MQKSKYKSKAAPEVSSGIYNDKFARCPKCFISKAEGVGTLLVNRIVRIKVEDGPNVDVARVVSCGSSICDFIGEVVMYRAATDYGISKGTIVILVRDNNGTTTFTAEEFRKGKTEKAPLPASILAMLSTFRPEFGRDYEPDKHIEGKDVFTEEVPF